MEKQILKVTVGNDNGNSGHKISINGKVISQPNVFARVKKLPLADDVIIKNVIENIENNLIVTINSPSVQPSIYFVGNYALASGNSLHNMEVGTFNDKASSDVGVVSTLSAIAGYAVKDLYKKHNDIPKDIEVHVKMTTALPVRQYNEKAAREIKEKFEKDKHSLTVHVGNSRVNVDIIFEFVKVLPEGVPTVFALQKYEKCYLSENEEMKKVVEGLFDEFINKHKVILDGSFFKNKKILHVAIGEGTTENPITDDILFNPNFMFGSDNGVGNAIDSALPGFKEEMGLRTLKRQNYSAILRDTAHKYCEAAQEHLEDPLEVEAEEILHNSKREIEKANNDVDIIAAYGGGSIMMKDHLYNKLESLGKIANIKLFYIPEKFAVDIEAVGLYEFTNSDIFETLYKRTMEALQQHKAIENKVKEFNQNKA